MAKKSSRVSRLEPIDTNLNVLQHLFRLLNQGFTILYGMDALILYKPTSLGDRANESKYRIYCSPCLRLLPNKLDQWRQYVHRLKLSLLIYLIVRYVSAMLLTLALYKWPHKRPELTEWLRRLGSPLSELPQGLLILYGFQVVTLVHALGLMPYNLSVKRPVDWVNNRILLDPTRELTRIDLVIREKLDELLLPEEPQLARLRFTKSLHFKHFQRLRRKWAIVGRLSGRLVEMRPAIYTNHWYQKLNFELPIRALEVSFLVLAVFAVIFLYFFSIVWQSKCRVRWARDDCDLGEAFTWQDNVAIADLSIGIILATGALCVSNTGIFYCSSSQELLIVDLRSELEHLLSAMYMINETHTREDEEEDLELDCRLIGASIHLKLVELDFRKCNKFMDEILKPQLLFASSTILLAISTDSLEVNPYRKFMIIAIVPIWLMTNVALIACARWHALATKIHPLFWSIMAQIQLRFKMASASRRKLMHGDLVSSAWFRLVQSKRFGSSWSSIKPFGVSITYTKIIKLNFFLISFVALLRSLAFV